MLSGLHDRNTTVKKTYASAIGHLVKVAKDSSVEKLINRLKEWYFEKEGKENFFPKVAFMKCCYAGFKVLV